MHRRHLLAVATAASAWPLLGARAWAAPGAADTRFLLVFLRGAYDALSAVVPRRSAFYAEVRPRIALPDSALTPLDADWGLHPALATTIAPLAQRGQAVFVPFAGTHDRSRSHFETQDRIELGQGDGAVRDYGSGFLNRLAQELGAGGRDARAMAFTDQLPIALRGSVPAANAPLQKAGRRGAAGSAPLQGALAAMYRGTALEERVNEGFAVREEVAREMAAEMQAASRGALSARGFEQEARRMARLLRERYTLGFVDIGGWDTHVNQGAASGQLATRLEELGRGLAAFADELGEAAWQRTTVVVLSEFGRTVRENGNRGTDHGHGSTHWVLGGGLAAGAGPVAGERAALAASTLFEGRDLPVLNDWRGVMGGLFARQFGLAPAALGRVFPGARVSDLRLV